MTLSDHPTRLVLGTPVLVVDGGTAVRIIDDRIRRGEPTGVAFLNAHLANVATRESDVADALQRFLVLNDGIGVDLASHILYGKPFPENLNGTDFTSRLLETTEHALRIFLIGGRASVVERAAAVIRQRWPTHFIVGYHHGYFSDNEENGIAATISALAPSLILVAMGNPRQERWIAKHAMKMNTCAMAVGAYFDFLTGEISRAPFWMRRARLEWVYRLFLEPRRMWKRYLIGNFVFLARVVRERICRKYKRSIGVRISGFD